MNKLLTKIVGVVLGTTMAVGVGVGVAVNNSRDTVDSEVRASEISSGTTTYVFNSASWGATVGSSAKNWTSGKAGAGFSNNGIQVTTNATGANGTSPDTFVGVSKIVLTYNTNKSAGAGTAVVKIGSNSDTSNNWAYSSGDGRTANYTLQYDYATTQSGAIKITLNTTTNSIYLVSCAVTCSSTPSTYSVTYDANGATSGEAPTDPTSYTAQSNTVTVLGQGDLLRTNYTFVGWNTAADGSGASYVEDDEFTISGDVTLYAQWSYNIHYVDNTIDNTITWDLTNPTYMNTSASQTNWSSPKATMVVDKAGSSEGTNNYIPPEKSSTRFYTNSKLTVSPIGGYKMVSISASATTENYASALASSTWSNASASATGTVVTITPTNGIAEVVATIGATTGLNSVVINYAVAPSLSNIAISGNLDKTDYILSENWDPTGLVVTATFSDSSSLDVTSKCSWSYNPSKANNTSITSVSITASYTYNEVEKTNNVSKNVTVTEQLIDDVINVGKTSATDTSYKTKTGIAGTNAVYTSVNAKATSANGGGLQFRATTNDGGVVSTTSGGLIKTVTLDYPTGKTGRVDIYGSNSAYSAPSALYSEQTQGVLLGSIFDDGSLVIEADYQYVGVRANNGTVYLLSITFSWGTYDPTAPTISINESGEEVEIGDTGTFTTATTGAGSNVVSWSSSDDSIMSINASTGVWTAVNVGMVTIKATLGSTGKKATVVMFVTGEISVTRARAIIDTLDGKDCPFNVTVYGYVTSSTGGGTSSTSNGIFIAAEQGGSDTLEIFFNRVDVTNWSSLSTVNNRIKAKGVLLKYNTTYELKNPTNAEVVSSDRAAVQDFVEDYLHMDYTDNLGYCNDQEHGYYLLAKAAFNDLTPSQQTLFKTDAEFTSAKARYEKWAEFNNDAAPYDGNDEVVTKIHSSNNFSSEIKGNVSIISITIIISVISLSTLCGYFLLRKRKEEK